MLVDEIKKANITAMKEKNTVARSIYSVVLNKIMLENINKREKGQEMVDGDVLAILQKTLKELADEKEGYVKVGNADRVKNIEMQEELVKKYLPAMLTEQEIYDIIEKLEDKSVGSVMKKFNAEYRGKCDMRLVQTVLKRF